MRVIMTVVITDRCNKYIYKLNVMILVVVQQMIKMKLILPQSIKKNGN